MKKLSIILFLAAALLSANVYASSDWPNPLDPNTPGYSVSPGGPIKAGKTYTVTNTTNGKQKKYTGGANGLLHYREKAVNNQQKNTEESVL